MEIKPYILASALQGIIAQRLVRRLCKDCAVEVAPEPDLLRALKVSPGVIGATVLKGKGCSKCNGSGYAGRVGIFELFVMTDDYRQMISSAYREGELLQLARNEGMKTLMEDGLEKVKLGCTTLEELLRVLGPQTGNERVCEQCERLIDAKFVFCPYCGAFRRNYCHTCRLPLDEEWTRCPFCGVQKGSEIIHGRN
jgi:RNA polymerase subunit RPABC4/transcription elongation factor Spt4